MSETIEGLTVEYVDEGITTVKQLDKVVLTKGAWTTIVYKYQDWDRQKEAYGPEKYTIRRYQKRNGQYVTKSKFNISNKEQAQKIIDVLQNWMKE
jgi:hypothetical protein